MLLYNFGYYITKPASKPEYISLKCSHILTVSDCICSLHPNLKATFWQNKEYEEERRDYQKLLGISDVEFNNLKVEVSGIFADYHLDVGSRFTMLSEALHFREKYLRSLNLKVISIALEDEFKDILRDFIIEDRCMNNIEADLILVNQEAGGELIGYDILGWDTSGFHSYLCNGLDKDILEKYDLSVNNVGLIQNDYEDVKIFAEHIKDKGEPVDWLPFSVYEHTVL